MKPLRRPKPRPSLRSEGAVSRRQTRVIGRQQVPQRDLRIHQLLAHRLLVGWKHLKPMKCQNQLTLFVRVSVHHRSEEAVVVPLAQTW